MRKLTAMLVAVALVSGCNLPWLPGVPDDGTQTETGVSTLKTFESAEELKAYFANVASNDFRFGFHTQLDEPVPLGGEAGAFDDMATGTDSSDGAGGATPPAAPGKDDADTDVSRADETGGFSDTTTQEEGVQEADVVKNDSTYIYVLTSEKLRIVNASPGEALSNLAALDLGGWGQDLYRLPETEPVATRIVAITQTDNWFGITRTDGAVDAAQIEPAIALPWFATPQTVVSVIDVSDHANPVVESTSTFDGSLMNSRMIGDKLYLVLAHYPDYYGGFPFDDVEDYPVDALLPDFTVTRNTGTATASEGDASADGDSATGNDTTTGNIVGWTGVYRPSDPDGMGMTSVVTMDVNQPADFKAVAVVAYPGNMYASTAAIYLTDTDYNFFTGDYRETTDIYKFKYTENAVELAATGSVPGRVLNQYSMSEYEDDLRIATTISATWFPGAERPSVNGLYVMAEQDGALSAVGSVEGLAPGEEIKSARFIGPRGYLVTFERTDPLFTFDLSNPTNPIQVGLLTVPGFSSFILPMGENHLLAVGEDIDLSEGWPRSNGVQLSIFDVSNLASPQLAHQHVIGAAGTYSEALNNPKALTYYASGNLLAVPIEHYEWVAWDGDGVTEPDPADPVNDGEEGDTGGGSGGSEGDATGEDTGSSEEVSNPTDGTAVAGLEIVPGFDGVYVYRVTVENGFEILGQMTTRSPEEEDSWWSYSIFSRGIFLGENVFSVNERGVVGAPVSDVNSAPWNVSFPADEQEWGDESPGESDGGEPALPPDEPIQPVEEDDVEDL